MTCEKTSQSKGSIYSWSFWVAIPSRLLSYCVQEKIFKLYRENSFLWCHQWPFILLFQNLAHINSFLNNVHFYIYLNWRFIFINALKQKCTLLEIKKRSVQLFFYLMVVSWKGNLTHLSETSFEQHCQICLKFSLLVEAIMFKV